MSKVLALLAEHELTLKIASDNLRYATVDPGILPMYLADMDFASPPEIGEALARRVAEGAYGYGAVSSSLSQILVEQVAKKYQWRISSDELVFLPGLVSALAVVGRIARSLKSPILVPTPCYPPFTRSPGTMEAEVIRAPLLKNEWRFDYDAFEHGVRRGARFLLLCNPHNPTGRVFSRAELEELAEWALSKRVTIVSDEIHCELVLDKTLVHTPIAALDTELRKNAITLLSPSKTYNLGGMSFAFAIIQDVHLREQFRAASADIVPKPNIFGFVAAEAAYRFGEPWRMRLLDQLRANRELISERLMPYGRLVQVNRPQATYLSWLDFSRCGWDNPSRVIREAGRLALGDGALFHAPECARLSFGAPTAVVEEALARIKAVLEVLLEQHARAGVGH